MSWASDNKFLIGFGAATLASVGALGYMTFTAISGYDAALSQFDTAGKEVERIGRLKPFPTEAYAKALATEKVALREKLDDLQDDFKRRVLPVEPITKAAFQDRLKDTVAAISGAASDAQVTLPDKFYMGYGEYQAKPPEDAAAPLLARQLMAIKLVMDLLIREGRLELKDLAREIFAEERLKGAPPPPKPGAPAAPAKAARKLVDKTVFTIKLVSTDAAMRGILNGITGHKEQLFIVRRVAVHNERPVSPPKIQGTVPPAPAPGEKPATPIIPATPGPSLEYTFGKELVETTIEIEVLDFAEPESKKATPAPGKAR